MNIQEVKLHSIKVLFSTRTIKEDYINFKKTGESKKYDWANLEKSLKEKGYRPKEHGNDGYISISRDYYLQDGHHRVGVLQELYKDDPDKTILVRMYRLPDYIILPLLLVAILLSLPFIFLIKVFKFLSNPKCEKTSSINNNSNNSKKKVVSQ